MEKGKKQTGMLLGILLIIAFSVAAFLIAELDWVKSMSFSPLIVGIIIGMIYANTLSSRAPESWAPGVKFCSKKILRLGIILYGFRLTFSDVVEVGLAAVCVDALIVTLTICGGVLIGKWLKMDRDIALLTSVGSAVCGAAAVLGAESAIKAKPYQTAVAVSTVVIFGTIAMFLYPVIYRTGILPLSPEEWGVFTGATVHEVAHVVGAGNAMSPDIASISIIVKMIRVMMLVFVLLALCYVTAVRAKKSGTAEGAGKVSIPWFAVLFLVVIALNSVIDIPANWLKGIEVFDTFLLTMAMTALGAETSFDKFRQAGAKPFLLAGILALWLFFGGFALTKLLVPILS